VHRQVKGRRRARGAALRYLQRLAGATGGDLGSVLGEAGGVDGALVGVDHQAGQTLHAALIPVQGKIYIYNYIIRLNRKRVSRLLNYASL